MPRRKPAVAGTFYEGDKERLLAQLGWCFTSSLGPGPLPPVPLRHGEARPAALICPHAGYVYSGPVAAHGYASLVGRRRPDSTVVLGPNHYGVGTSVSIYPAGEWVTPLGPARIDHMLAAELAEQSDLFSMDETSHMREHSIEVQVPFLQYLLGDPLFVPVCMLDQSESAAAEVGEALARVVAGRDILIIASSDFTHYEPHSSVKDKDQKALEKIKELDISGLYSVLDEYGITACGYGPIAAMMTAARRLGARSASLLKHATSGDTSGDYSSVVGYASCMVELPP